MCIYMSTNIHMEDDHFLDLFKGKRIKLSLRTSYFGVVQRIDANKALVLADVVNGSNGCHIPGIKVFFAREILNVELVNETRGDDSGITDVCRHESPPNVERIWDNDEDKEDHVPFVVIDNFREKFGAAVIHLKKQCVISVGADGLKMFEHGRLCWLQIATKKKVFLFDILLLGPMGFRNGISSILENKHILKVLHDCREIAGCLMGQFGVKLNNVFDTQVADVVCFHSATGGFFPDRVSSLEQALRSHLQVPSSHLLSLQTKSQLTQEGVEVWRLRPCPLPVLRLMAVSVTHLQALRLVLMDNLMMDYMKVMESYLNNSSYKPGELQHINLGASALPPELRELERMPQERREQAINRYPVNEQGLLARFSPQAQPPPQTSPAAQEPVYAEAPLVEPSSSLKQLDLVLPSDVCVSTKPKAQTLQPAPASDLGKKTPVGVPPVPLGAGRGHRAMSVDGCGGRPFGKVQSSFNPMPAVGRGHLLHMSHTQNPSLW